MNSEAPNEWRYYKLDALTKELNSVAQYESLTRNIMCNMSALDLDNSGLPDLDDSGLPDFSAKEVQLSIDEERKQYAWMNEDVTMQNIANWIYTRNGDALLAFAQAAKHYADLYKDFRNVRMAQLCVIMACNYFWKLGYDRSQVTLGLIKTYAEIFWRKCRDNGSVPEVRWPDIFKSLGLDDLPPIPSGRPPANLPERDVPGFASKYPRRRERGRSSKEFGGNQSAGNY